MKRKVLALALLLALGSSADARPLRGGGSISTPSTFTPQWSPWGLGGGGQTTAIYNYSNDAVLVRTDTNGFYVRETVSNCVYGGRTYSPPCYRQGFTASNTPGFNIDQSGLGGAIESVACPSNTNVIYAFWGGSLYISQDNAVSWIKATGISTTQGANNGNANGPWIACDPNTPGTAIIDTGTGGVYYTTNGTSGSPSFTGPISAIGTGSAVSLTFEQGSSSNIMACKVGTGCYRSTTGVSGTFTLTTSGPTTGYHPWADKCGQIWAATGGTTVYKYASGSWSNVNTAGSGAIYAVTTDPTSSCGGTHRVVALFSTGQPNVSNDNGATWTDNWFNQTATATGSQPAWLAVANQSGGSGAVSLNGYSGAFDSAGNLRFAGGVGVWKLSGTVQGGPSVSAWQADTVGIEQLVVNKLLSPSGSAPMVATWDKGMIRNPNPWNFASSYYNQNTPNDPIIYAWSADIAANDPAIVGTWLPGNSFLPATSSNGGSTYTLWGTGPLGSGVGGDLAMLTSQKFLLQPGAGQPLYYTLNGATSFTASTVPGSPTDWTLGQGVGWGLAADKVAANTYCAAGTSKNVFYSTDSGQTFTKNVAASAAMDGSPNLFFLRGANGTSDFFFTSGEQSGSAGAHPANTRLWKLTKTTNPCDTATSVNSNLKEVESIGFGAVPPNGSATYATMIYVYGWFNNVLGFYKSLDGGTNWATIDVPASERMYALNSIDIVSWIEGDPDIYGRINVGFRGAGAAFIDTADACPWISFSNVVANQSISGSSVSITAVHSGLVPATGANLYVDGVQVGSTQTGTTSNGTTTYTFTLNATANAGSRTLKVQAAGNGCTFGGTGNFKQLPVTLSHVNDNSLMRNVA